MSVENFKKSSKDIRYLELLSDQYPTIDGACTEIINLQAILNLPKGTEHFVSDIHGEYEAFDHVLRNASGVIKNYIEEIYGNTLRDSEKKSLATLIYYPEEKLKHVQQTEDNLKDWYTVVLLRMVMICKRVSSKCTRSKVRKAMPKEYAYILEELIHEDKDRLHKFEYYNEIIKTIVELDRAPNFIVAISNLIQRLAIDHLHVIGDIYDRGPSAHLVMDRLEKYHSLDIQWGNHDVLWMGAASGSLACTCNAIRICARYNNLSTIEDGYGINLVPLATFAMETYKPEDCKIFRPKLSKEEKGTVTQREIELLSMMHKAITIVQFKVEAAIIKRNPSFFMDDRLLLHHIQQDTGEINIDGTLYKMRECSLPTVRKDDPYALTDEESEMVEKLQAAFSLSSKLQSHVRLLFNKGSMYNIYNSNLLFHGCIPLNGDGSLREVPIGDQAFKGKAFMDELERIVRKGYFTKDDEATRLRGNDIIWYLWCGRDSPLFGKTRMTTFERYFIEDKAAHYEEKDPYYAIEDMAAPSRTILENFGLDPENSHIINGHVPVQVRKGETPIKAGGNMIVIDGGFSKAYQSMTGIAGYTLIYNSKGLMLASHEPFTTMKDAVENEKDIVSMTAYRESPTTPKKVRSTDVGKELMEKITDLKKLVHAYNKGIVKEKI